MAPLFERDIRELIDTTRNFYSSLRKRDVDELEYRKLCKKGVYKLYLHFI